VHQTTSVAVRPLISPLHQTNKLYRRLFKKKEVFPGKEIIEAIFNFIGMAACPIFLGFKVYFLRAGLELMLRVWLGFFRIQLVSRGTPVLSLHACTAE
jgi:hypothetical protein